MGSRKFRIGRMVIYIALFAFSLVTLMPIIWMLLSSFKTNVELISLPPTFLPNNFTVENYRRVWQQIDLALNFRNSLFLSVVKTVIILYTSALSGYVFSKVKFKGQNALFMFILSTMMVPGVVTMIPRYQEMIYFKWIGSYNSLIFTAVFDSFGIFMMKQFMDTLPIDFIEAARIDGCGEFKIFHRIVIPNLTSALSALAIFQFLWSWDDFQWPLLMLNDASKYTLPLALETFSGQYATDYAGLLAGTSIAIVPVLIVYVVFQNQFVEGITFSGIKT